MSAGAKDSACPKLSETLLKAQMAMVSRCLCVLLWAVAAQTRPLHRPLRAWRRPHAGRRAALCLRAGAEAASEADASEKVAELCAMGWESAQAEAALAASGGDVAAAAEALSTLARERAAASPRGVDDIAVIVLVFNC